MALPKQLIDINRIYLEPAVETYARGQEILAKYPHAERTYVESHWKIPPCTVTRATPRTG
jgi:spore photoproduct lyase